MTIKDLILAREKFKTSDPATGLPGREDKIRDLECFLVERLKIRKTTEEKKARVKAGLVADIQDRHFNKTVFVCGVPGTGKTAVVKSVVEKLHRQLKERNCPLQKFQYYYINGQQITAPEKIYSEIYYHMTGVGVNTDKAQDLLDEIFLPREEDVDEDNDEDEDDEPTKKTSRRKRGTTKKMTTTNNNKKKKVKNVDLSTYKVIIIDELDLLYNEKRPQVFYNLFDWPTSAQSKVILITIANAMDLPERFARGRISSRIGWNKVVFEPYTSVHLESILKARLGEELMKKCFDHTAILVATKRIGKTTGDARRILDTCCLAVDEAINQGRSKVTAKLIDSVGFQNIDKMKVNYVQNCPPMQILTLKGILKETESQGEANVTAYGVLNQLNHLLSSIDHEWLQDKVVSYEELYQILNILNAVGLICLEGLAKPLMEKNLYIKDTSESFRDVIRSATVKLD